MSNEHTEHSERTMKVGGKYNWKGQPERLIYLGRNWSGNGYWNQFALMESPNKVWCEVLDSDLHMIEETLQQSPEQSERAELSIERLHAAYRLRLAETTNLDPWFWFAAGVDEAAALLAADKAGGEVAVDFEDWYENAIWGNEDFKEGCWRAWDAAIEAVTAGSQPQPSALPDDVVKDALLDAMKHVKLILEAANNDPHGPISDTIWASPYETLFDFIDAAIDAAMLKEGK